MGEGRGLGCDRRFRDLDRDVALRDGNTGDGNIFAEDNRAGLLVYDDPRWCIHRNRQVLDFRQKAGRGNLQGCEVQFNGSRIAHESDRAADPAIDGIFNPGGRCEVRTAQGKCQTIALVEVISKLPLDPGPIRNSTGRWSAARFACALGLNVNTAYNDRPLRNGIDFIVCPLERREA